MAWTIHQKPIKNGEPSLGLGWHLAPDGTRWHNGQTGGYSAFFALFPEASRAVVVLANVALASEPERIGLGLLKSISAP